jgi:hypothetical protein
MAFSIIWLNNTAKLGLQSSKVGGKKKKINKIKKKHKKNMRTQDHKIH